MTIYAIAAMAENRVIGVEGRLPWRLPEDMKRFAALTRTGDVLMGRKTYDSLPPKSKPLPERLNLVLSRGEVSGADHPSVKIIRTVEEGTAPYRGEGDRPLWIVGGEEIYRQTAPLWDRLYLTVVEGAFDGDAFMPPFEGAMKLIEEKSGDRCRYLTFERA